MEDTNKKRVGRPKATPQTGPLVLEGSRARTTVEVELADTTAEELKEYARWVELSSSLTTNDAAFTTVDYALRELFRRDRMWQERKREPERKDAAAPERKEPAASAAVPPRLPPPNGAGASRAASERAT
jgi:hypothetical protein